MTRLWVAAAALAIGTIAAAAGDDAVKIGVLNDQSSSHAAIGGKEAVAAATLAIADFGGEVLGRPIELVSADHRNSRERGVEIAREWLEQDGVDAIADMSNSAIALDVNMMIGQQKKVGLFVSPLTDRPTEEDCNGHVVAWAYDAHSIIASTAKALLAQGHEAFFILSADNEAGAIQEEALQAALTEGGGEVVGKARAPLGTTDFVPLLKQAEAAEATEIVANLSGAELVALARAFRALGLAERNVELSVTFLHQADIRAIGVETLGGVRFAIPWFWEKDDESRAWGRRMMAITGHAPGWIAAGTYSAVRSYLEAVKAAGTDASGPVLTALDSMPIDDFFVDNGDLLRNGRLVRDMYLVEVRTPAEVTEPEDFLKLVAVVPAAEAFRPLSQSDCKLP